MAIIDYQRVGGREHTMEIDNKGVVTRRYSLKFQVITNSPTDSEGFIRQDVRTPRLGNIFTDVDGFVDLIARCKRVNVNEQSAEQDMRVHEVVAEYDTTPFEQERPEDPLQWETTVDFDPENMQVAIDRDVVTGLPLTNSAGDAPEPPIMADIALARITIKRNEPPITSYGLVYTWLNKVNSDVWLGAQPYTVLITSIKPVLKQDSRVPGGYYSEVTYQFLWNPMLDHRVRFLDLGYREVVGGERRTCFDDTGTAVSAAVPLDGAGAKLPTGGTPVFRGPFNKFVPTAFAPLGLP